MGIEIPTGEEETAPAPAPAPAEVVKPNTNEDGGVNTSEKEPGASNKGRNICVCLIISAIVLAAIVVLVPNWDDKGEDEKAKEKKPFAKVFDPALPIFNGKLCFLHDI